MIPKTKEKQLFPRALFRLTAPPYNEKVATPIFYRSLIGLLVLSLPALAPAYDWRFELPVPEIKPVQATPYPSHLSLPGTHGAGYLFTERAVPGKEALTFGLWHLGVSMDETRLTGRNDDVIWNLKTLIRSETHAGLAWSTNTSEFGLNWTTWRMSLSGTVSSAAAPLDSREVTGDRGQAVELRYRTAFNLKWERPRSYHPYRALVFTGAIGATQSETDQDLGELWKRVRAHERVSGEMLTFAAGLTYGVGTDRLEYNLGALWQKTPLGEGPALSLNAALFPLPPLRLFAEWAPRSPSSAAHAAAGLVYDDNHNWAVSLAVGLSSARGLDAKKAGISVWNYW